MSNNLWHKTADGDLPEVGKIVVGIWSEQAAKCYRMNNEWIDKFHNCYCYTAPTYWAYIPIDE